jgi:hypothetical protein
MDARTPSLLSSLYLLVFGIGIGLVMQVLVLLVQNAADPALMGTATAANNFFREIGASLGVAVVGSVFTARLTAGLTTAVAPDSGISAGSLTPEGVLALPESLRATVVDVYASALTPVLGWLVPLFVVGLVLVVLLPDLPLRTTLAAPTAPRSPTPGAP